MKKPLNPRIAGLVLVSVALIGLSFLEPLAQAAVFFWGAGFIAMIGALVVAVKTASAHRPQSDAEEGARRRGGTGIALVAVAAAFAVAAIGTVRATDQGSSSLSALAFEPSATAQTLAVSNQTVDLSDEALEPVVTDVAETASALSELESGAKAEAVENVRSLEYAPQSGLEPYYSEASVYEYEDAVVVSVPLKGTNLPEVTKITFMTVGDRTSVIELRSELVSETEVAFSMWQDGVQTHNAVLENPDGTATDSGVQRAGVDWQVLNDCLAGAGINWAILAVISTACAAACATMVLCAPCISAMAGWTGGTIAGCVEIAWV